MADLSLVRNDLLCFMVNVKIHVRLRQLKSVLVVDFYTVESLSEAKERFCWSLTCSASWRRGAYHSWGWWSDFYFQSSRQREMCQFFIYTYSMFKHVYLPICKSYTMAAYQKSQ